MKLRIPRAQRYILSIALLFSGCSTLHTIGILQSGTGIIEKSANEVIQFKLLGHLMLVDVYLNDQGDPYQFILDTGALTVISQKVAQDIQPAEDIQILSKDVAGNTQDVRLATIEKISLGGVRVNDCAAAIFDLHWMGDEIDGILGSNFLRHFFVQLDYDSRTIEFDKGQSGNTGDIGDQWVIPFDQDMTNGYAPQIECVVDDAIKVKAIIDTGNPDFFSVPLSVAKKTSTFQQGKVLTSEGSVAGGAFGLSQGSYLFKLKQLQMGDRVFHGVSTVTSTSKDALIGYGFLSNFVITLDYPNNEIRLKPIHSVEDDFEFYSFGLALNRVEDKTIVVGLWENSAAERSGIQLGEEITTINSIPVNTLSLLEMMAQFRDPETENMEVELKRERVPVVKVLHYELLQPP